MKLSICCLLLAVLLSPFTSFAQTPSGQLGVPSLSTDVPKVVRFSGPAMDETGKPLTGVLGVTFSLYKDQQGGAPLWVETQNVQADANGHYTTLLGSASVEGVPLSLFSSGEAQWLGVQVQGQLAQPRVLLVSVPYALKAHEAETLSGKSISDFVLLNKSAAAPITAGSAPAISNGASGSKLPSAANGPTSFVGTNTTQIVAVTQKGTGAGLSATAVSKAAVSGTITGKSNTAVYGLATNTGKGSNAAGVTGAANTETGPGVQGVTTSPKGFGVQGVVNSTTGGTAVQGLNNATSGVSSGVSGQSASTGNGSVGVAGFESANKGQVYGVSGGTNSTTNGAVGVIGYNNATSGVVAGVVGTTASSSGTGVSAAATAATGSANGVFAQSASTNGTGVVGYASATSGPTIGVFGVATSPSGAGGIFTNLAGGNAAVIIGNGANSKPIFVVDASGNGHLAGNLNVTGKLTKGSGSFKIDHPLDPANKYLSHSFVESPDMMNVYNGVVVLDAHGSAWVMLPDYFEALNRDFRYQLTAIGAPGPNLYIAQEVSGNRFHIAGGKPHAKVSWQVTGIRHDAYANNYRIPTEEEKPAAEQGYYLHPEVFGQPASKSIQAASQKAPASDQVAKMSNP